jgi:hypothetical protein
VAGYQRDAEPCPRGRSHGEIERQRGDECNKGRRDVRVLGISDARNEWRCDPEERGVQRGRAAARPTRCQEAQRRGADRTHDCIAEQDALGRRTERARQDAEDSVIDEPIFVMNVLRETENVGNELRTVELRVNECRPSDEEPICESESGDCDDSRERLPAHHEPIASAHPVHCEAARPFPWTKARSSAASPAR